MDTIDVQRILKLKASSAGVPSTATTSARSNIAPPPFKPPPPTSSSSAAAASGAIPAQQSVSDLHQQMKAGGDEIANKFKQFGQSFQQVNLDGLANKFFKRGEKK